MVTAEPNDPDAPNERRAAMLTAVLEVARRQLGEVGPSALSLRSIAREVGVVPSALYRYLPGRDAILTELIRTGYERLGTAVDGAEAEIARADLAGRWRTVWRTTRAWCVANPHEYALLYGTPLIGYAAPPDTVVPATRVVVALARIALEGSADAAPSPPDRPDTAVAAVLQEDVARVLAALPGLGLEPPDDVVPDTVLRVLEAWTLLFGAISFEIFGHYTHSIDHGADYLDHLADRSARAFGLS